MSKVFQQKLGTKINSSKAWDPLKIIFLSLSSPRCSSLPWLQPCLSHKKKTKTKKNIQYITKCDVKVMTHLNFGRNNGKPAADTSWGLGDVGGKLRLGGGGNLSLGEGSWPPQHPPNDAPGFSIKHSFSHTLSLRYYTHTHTHTCILYIPAEKKRNSLYVCMEH